MAENQLIDYLCKLSKLSYDEESKERVAGEMQSIMEVMDTIKEVDICEADYPLEFPGTFDGLREDELGASLSMDEALANVPDRKFHFIAVKKIIGE